MWHRKDTTKIVLNNFYIKYYFFSYPLYRSNIQSPSSGAVRMQYPLPDPVQPHTDKCPNQQSAIRHPGWHQSGRLADLASLHVQRWSLSAPRPHQQRPSHSRSASGQRSLRGSSKPWSQRSAAAAATKMVPTATADVTVVAATVAVAASSRQCRHHGQHEEEIGSSPPSPAPPVVAASRPSQPWKRSRPLAYDVPTTTCCTATTTTHIP